MGTCYRNTCVGNDSKTDPVSQGIMSMSDTLHLEKLKAFLQQKMVRQQSEEQISCKQRRFFVRYTPDKELNSQRTSCKYQENNQHTKDQASPKTAISLSQPHENQNYRSETPIAGIVNFIKKLLI